MGMSYLCAIDPELFHGFKNFSLRYLRKTWLWAIFLACTHQSPLFMSLHRTPASLLSGPDLLWASNPFSKHKSEGAFSLPNEGLVGLEKDNSLLAGEDLIPICAVSPTCLWLCARFSFAHSTSSLGDASHFQNPAHAPLLRCLLPR